jgi:hypothetical protein
MTKQPAIRKQKMTGQPHVLLFSIYAEMWSSNMLHQDQGKMTSLPYRTCSPA